MPDVSKPVWRDRPEGRFFTRIPVTSTLPGVEIALPLHVVIGRHDGPTLGILGTVHGDETLPAMMIRRLLDGIDTATLAGRVAAIPVSNPFAMATFSRQTPEQHGKTDLHEVFPGNPKGNLTQMLAAAITTNLLDHVNALIDFHAGGSGGRLQSRVDFDEKAPPEVRARSIELCRAFGVQFVHENNLAGTATRYVNARGVATVNAEIGGSYLGPEPTERYLAEGVKGLRNTMAALGMFLTNDPPEAPPRQLLFGVKSRFEVNPSRGGFLVSHFEQPADLGRRIAKGTRLGEVVDMHSFQTLEELVAPIDSYLFFSRYSGVVEGGTKAFALAEESSSQWLT